MGAVARTVDPQDGIEIIDWGEGKTDASIDVVGIIVVRPGEIFQKAVAPLILKRAAYGENVADDRGIGDELHATIVVVAVVGGDLQFLLLRRLLGDEID